MCLDDPSVFICDSPCWGLLHQAGGEGAMRSAFFRIFRIFFRIFWAGPLV